MSTECLAAEYGLDAAPQSEVRHIGEIVPLVLARYLSSDTGIGQCLVPEEAGLSGTEATCHTPGSNGGGESHAKERQLRDIYFARG